MAGRKDPRVLATNVHLQDTKTYEPHVFVAGTVASDLPKWALDVLDDNIRVWVEDDSDAVDDLGGAVYVDDDGFGDVAAEAPNPEEG